MRTAKATKEPEIDPKTGKPRARSGVAFPYWDLDSATEVVRKMHHQAGGTCDNAQLAALLNYSGVENGSFRTRVSSAKMFGLVEETDDRRLRVSARGSRIVAPVTPGDATSARVEAFLAVDLFKRVFERFHGAKLPEQAGLRNLLQTEFQVVPARIAPTVRILLDSAEQAGLFGATGTRTRMVMPLAANPGPVGSMPVTATDEPQRATPTRLGPGGGDGGPGGGIDPAIAGLLRLLPPSGTPMSAKRRKALVDAFTTFVEFVYRDDADEGVE